MNKLDFIKQDKGLYKAGSEPALVEVPTMAYLMYDGRGAPEGNPEFQRAFQALYGVAYTIKFIYKKAETPPGYRDFKVPPPEGLWWMGDGKEFDTARPEDWRWTLMIRVPGFVTPKVVRAAIAELVAKKKDDVYATVRLERLAEGKAVQVMHVGPYDNEAVDLAKMESYLMANGLHYHGKHHEIYFGDPRRSKPEKLRTILRHPVTAG